MDDDGCGTLLLPWILPAPCHGRVTGSGIPKYAGVSLRGRFELIGDRMGCGPRGFRLGAADPLSRGRPTFPAPDS